MAGEKLECLPYIVHDFDTKMESKCALVQNKKPVDNYVDASHKRSSYPQGSDLGLFVPQPELQRGIRKCFT